MGLAKVHCGATPPSVMVLFSVKLELKNFLERLNVLFDQL